MPSEASDDGCKVSDLQTAAMVQEQAKEEAARLVELQSPTVTNDADVAFRRGLEELVRDHFDSCMALASAHDPGTGTSGTSFQDGTGCSRKHQEDVDSDFEEFDERPDANLEHEHIGEASNVSSEASRPESALSRRRNLSQWYERRAEQVITTMERQARQAELLALAGLHAVSMLDSSFLRESSSEQIVERPRPGTSPLVQMWRGLEGEHRRQEGFLAERNRETRGTSRNEVSTERNSDHGNERGPESVQVEEVQLQEESPRAPEPQNTRNIQAHQAAEVDESERASVRQVIDRWMNERIGNSSDSNLSRHERNELLDLSERERVRELARDWLQATTQRRTESGDADRDSESWEAERRRDRQLILDLLMRTEQERQRELEDISEHRAVSRFPHRGRLQSFLRGRLLRTTSATDQDDVHNSSAAATELGQLRQRRAVSGLRDGLRYRLETIVRGQASEPEGVVHGSSSLAAGRPTNHQGSTAEERIRRWTALQEANHMELQELISRRSVSTILASEFRDRLDQLIRSLIQRPWPVPSAAQPQQNAQRRFQPRPTAVPPAPPPPENRFWQRDVPSSSEYVVWDNAGELRKDISRLQQGLGDLQRMVEACVDMQLELQRSIRQEVAGALQRMYAGREIPDGAVDGSPWTPVKKGICFICCDKSIDSLLYRCGHMCTCLKCANQLMQSASKCPMCRAPIVEVIRAFTIA